MRWQQWHFSPGKSIQISQFSDAYSKRTQETAISLTQLQLHCSLGLGAIRASGELALTGGVGGGAAPRVHPAAREEEAERVPGHGGEQHAAVEGHDGQHDQVRRPHPGGVRRREQRGRGRRDAATATASVAAPAARDAARGRGERLGERGEREHEEEAERVGAPAARARPPREQHHRAVAPEEGHVHHGHVRARRRRYRLARPRRRRVSGPVRRRRHRHRAHVAVAAAGGHDALLRRCWILGGLVGAQPSERISVTDCSYRAARAGPDEARARARLDGHGRRTQRDARAYVTRYSVGAGGLADVRGIARRAGARRTAKQGLASGGARLVTEQLD
jgi:hypothetical protein